MGLRSRLVLALAMLLLVGPLVADRAGAIPPFGGPPVFPPTPLVVLGTGLYTAIAVDAAGNPHMSYYNDFTGDLMYATKAGGAWTIETVDSGPGRLSKVGLYTSIAIDSQGHPHISYHHGTLGDLKYANRSATGIWTTETVDSAGITGKFTSLALDAEDLPHVAYLDETGRALKYARKQKPGWTIETVETVSLGNVGHYCALALDSAGNPHIAYARSLLVVDAVRYATRSAAGVWSFEEVTASFLVAVSFTYIDLMLDAADVPHVVFHASGSSLGGPGGLRYATKDGGAWTVESIEDPAGVGHYASINITPGVVSPTAFSFPTLDVVYHDSLAGQLKHAEATLGPFGRGPWTIEIVDAGGDVGSHAAFVVHDATRTRHVSYHDAIANSLLYATRQAEDATWIIETVE